jgi:GGDEF domain-containing protein
VTGLATARVAEEAIQRAIEGRSQEHAVLFCVERLASINERFGFAAGDQLLLLCSQQIAQTLDKGEHLYRWRGPALLAVLSGEYREAVASRVRRMAPRFDHSMDFNQREVVVRVTTAQMHLRLGEEPSLNSVRGKLDAFVASIARSYGAETQRAHGPKALDRTGTGN